MCTGNHGDYDYPSICHTPESHSLCGTDDPETFHYHHYSSAASKGRMASESINNFIASECVSMRSKRTFMDTSIDDISVGYDDGLQLHHRHSRHSHHGGTAVTPSDTLSHSHSHHSRSNAIDTAISNHHTQGQGHYSSKAVNCIELSVPLTNDVAAATPMGSRKASHVTAASQLGSGSSSARCLVVLFLVVLLSLLPHFFGLLVFSNVRSFHMYYVTMATETLTYTLSITLPLSILAFERRSLVPALKLKLGLTSAN